MAESYTTEDNQDYIPDANRLLNRYLAGKGIESDDVEEIESDHTYSAMLGSADPIRGYFTTRNNHIYLSDEGLEYVKLANNYDDDFGDETDALGETIEEFVPFEVNKDVAGVNVEGLGDYNLIVNGEATGIDQVYAFTFDNPPEMQNILEEVHTDEESSKKAENAIGMGIAVIGDEFGELQVSHKTSEHLAYEHLLNEDKVQVHSIEGKDGVNLHGRQDTRS